MSNSELATCKNKIHAITAEQILVPIVPIDVYAQEAENLVVWCREDIPELSKAGITEETIADLDVRSGALRQCQSIWIKDRRSIKEAELQWRELSPEASDFRNELLHTFRYAFRANPLLLGRLSEIADGNSDSDTIQDLNNLAVLGKENINLLTAISFDGEKLNKAANLSGTSANILAEANGSKQKGNESKVIRDKSYTYLKLLVDEIRAAGKYLFWRNPDRLKGYSSDYWRRVNRSKNKENIDI